MAYDPSNPFGGGASPYDAARKRAVQQAGNQSNQGMDAINRRYAAMGMSNSGSAIKSDEENKREVQEGLQNTLGNIDMGEQGAANEFAKQGNAQNFQAGEANKEIASREGMQKTQLGQQAQQFGQEMTLRNREADQKQQQLNQEEKAMAINQQMNEWQQKHSGGLLGSGGFLGTGIG